MKSISRATPMLFSAEVQNTGTNTCFWIAACRPARISSSDSPPWAKNFSISASSDSAMYSISCLCNCLARSASAPVAGASVNLPLLSVA